ncbi:MAG: TonB-dependent receptor plug domain-containing protein, partial [Pseudomonadota bacterium]
MFTRLVTGACSRPQAAAFASATVLLLTGAAVAVAQPSTLPEITVIDRAQNDDRFDLSDRVLFMGADPTELLGAAPGGAVNNNGPLSLQAQYRGMFGPRVNVAIDGLGIVSGGPNWMDPPLHYLPPGLLDTMVLQRGIAPVTAGSSVGGAAQATAVRGEFTGDDTFSLQGRFSAGAASANDSTDLTGLIAVANDRHRLHVLGAIEEGDDARSARGDLRGTSYERDTYGVGYGLRLTGDDYIAIDYLRTQTGNSGNPVLPLDIEFFNTNRTTLSTSLSPAGVAVEARVRIIDVDHRMNNFELRDAPDFSQLTLPPFQGDDRRFV